MNQFAIEKHLNDTAKNAVDIYISFFETYMLDPLTAPEILKIVLELSEKYEYNMEAETLSTTNSQVELIGDQYFNLLHEVVISITKQNYTPEIFYQKLFKAVFCSELFPDDTISKGILLFFLAEKIVEIPYYQTNKLITMTNREYKSTIEILEPQIRKAIYMLNRGFTSRTEEASQILDVLNNITKYEEQVVFLSVLVDILKTGRKEANNDE